MFFPKPQPGPPASPPPSRPQALAHILPQALRVWTSSWLAISLSSPSERRAREAGPRLPWLCLGTELNTSLNHPEHTSNPAVGGDQ